MPIWLPAVLGLVASLALVWLALVACLWLARPGEATVTQLLRLLPDLLRLLRRLTVDPDVPRGVRLGIWCALGYLAMPIDLVPDFLPVVGWVDDVVVVALVLRAVVRRAGPQALERCWPGSPDGLAALVRLVGAST